MIIAAKTLTMPPETEMGILVNSLEAPRPERIGIKVIKNPKIAHLTNEIMISEKFDEFNNIFE